MKAVVVDNNLPISLAKALSQKGFEATHVLDVGLGSAPDQILRERFRKTELVFVTRDNDFWMQRPAGWAVVWLALHNPTLAQIRGPIADLLAARIPSLKPGQRLLVAADQTRLFEA
jgi:predicted nuclease of predicted toxin-antitoxin system